jgi:acetyl esterase/lipase
VSNLCLAQQGTTKTPPVVTVDADGTVHMPSFLLPQSSFLSPEAKRAYLDHLLWPGNGGHPSPSDAAQARKQIDDILFLPSIARQKALYPVHMESQTIAGVYTDVITPAQGVSSKNSNRILINLHGGGFVTGARTAGPAESIPIASIGRIKVISIDYRQGPEYKFPAASEDVAAVYTELLKQYPAKHIGIYGCSAGGQLTAMSVAWFDRHHLPQPGAVGILCASAGAMGEGDSHYLGVPLNGNYPSPSVETGRPQARTGYLSDVDPKDPLVAPLYYPQLLAKFPPTLLITGTRSFEMSSVVYTHTQLVKAGVDAELHIWDGLWHGWWYNPDLPESKAVYDVIVSFFDRHLGAN